MKSLKIILVGGLLLPSLLSADVSAVGVGESISKAKKDALSALSQVIKSEVRTYVEVEDSEVGKRVSSKTKSNIKITSNLPLLGTDFITLDTPSDDVKVKAKLISSNVKRLYIQKMKQLKNEIRSTKVEIRATHSSSIKLELYQNIYSLLSEYDRYETVATILGVKNFKRPLMTEAKVKSEILKLHSNINSLNMATTIFAESFKEKKIFVKPPTIDHNANVSDFGYAFQKMLQSKIRHNASHLKASYILSGTYSVGEKSMIINYELINATTKEIKKSKTITLNKQAYSHLATKPKGVDFNTLLKSGIAKSSDLQVSLSSNKGTEQLIFSDGEEIELFVKLNKKGYLYIVGTTQTDGGEMSYLVELSEGMGNSKFLKLINQDDASRWLSLGSFEVAPPFGIESLQVIASNTEIKKLPNTIYDNEQGYYIIATNIKKALVATRGIRPKRTDKVETSEDVISFRTMK